MLKDLYEFWGEIYQDKSKEEEQQVNNDALSSFLNSSLNVELVFIILKSINFFAEEYKKKMSGSYLGVAVVADADNGASTMLKVTRIDFSKPETIMTQLIAQNKLCQTYNQHEITIINVDAQSKPTNMIAKNEDLAADPDQI